MTIVDAILQGLETQTFYDWYQSDVDDYITGEKGCKTEDQIRSDIRRIFRVDKIDGVSKNRHS